MENNTNPINEAELTDEELEALTNPEVVTPEDVGSLDDVVGEPEVPAEPVVDETPVALETSEEDQTPPVGDTKDGVEDGYEYDGEVTSWTDVKAVLALPTSTANKMEIIMNSGFKAGELFVAFFVDYNNLMKANVSAVDGSKSNTRLYNQLMTVLNIKDDEEFKVKFDLINFIFRDFTVDEEGNKLPFNEFMLTRFSDSQKLAAAQLNTYHRLVVLIASLADAQTRKGNKKSLSGFGAKGSVLTDEHVSRLKRYYEM